MAGRISWVKVRASAAFLFAALVFSVAGAGRVGATVINASPVDFSAPEQSSFAGGVATFTDSDPNAGPASFTATIDWGDGTPLTPGTFGASEDTFVVIGQHVYADEGTFTATVTISDVPPGTGTATVTSTGTITEADVLSGLPPKTFNAMPGVGFTTTVASFSDSLVTANPTDLIATINWGDGTTTAGTVSGGGGTFEVSGTHTYAAAGLFPVQVTLSDDPPGTATATVTSTAQVVAAVVTIPTLNLEGFLVLGFALVGAALYLLRARKRTERGSASLPV